MCSHDAFAAPVRNQENHLALSGLLQPQSPVASKKSSSQTSKLSLAFSPLNLAIRVIINSLNPGGCKLSLVLLHTGSRCCSSPDSLSLSDKDGSPSDRILVIVLLKLSAVALDALISTLGSSFMPINFYVSLTTSAFNDMCCANNSAFCWCNSPINASLINVRWPAAIRPHGLQACDTLILHLRLTPCPGKFVEHLSQLQDSERSLLVMQATVVC